MKKLCLVLFIAMLALTLCGCGVTINYAYSDAGKYSAGDATVSGTVEKLDIDWIDGRVTLAYQGENTVKIAETSRKKLSEGESVHWWLDGTTLYIKYAQSGKTITDNLKKELTVTLPEGTVLKDAKIASVSGTIHCRPLYAENVKLSSVSGGIDAECAASSFEADTVSGKISLTASANEINLSATSGAISADIGHAEKVKINETSGKITLKALEIKKTEIATISGSVEAALQKGESLGISSVSGSVRLSLPKEQGFKAELSTVSGSIKSELSAEKNGKSYIAGDGSMTVTMNSVSGGLTLSEYKEK